MATEPTPPSQPPVSHSSPELDALKDEALLEAIGHHLSWALTALARYKAECHHQSSALPSRREES